MSNNERWRWEESQLFHREDLNIIHIPSKTIHSHSVNGTRVKRRNCTPSTSSVSTSRTSDGNGTEDWAVRRTPCSRRFEGNQEWAWTSPNAASRPNMERNHRSSRSLGLATRTMLNFPLRTDRDGNQSNRSSTNAAQSLTSPFQCFLCRPLGLSLVDACVVEESPSLDKHLEKNENPNIDLALLNEQNTNHKDTSVNEKHTRWTVVDHGCCLMNMQIG